MKKMYQQVKLEIVFYQNEDIVTLSTGNPEEKFFDTDWAGFTIGTGFNS